MSKHTAGQLRIDKFSGMGQPQLEISSDGHVFWIAGVGAPCEDPKVAMANAILFHAAPDLLEACRAFVAWMYEWYAVNGRLIGGGIPEDEALVAVARSTEIAIAKAIGEAQDVDTTD